MIAADTHDLLRKIIAETRCKPGWSFHLVDEDGALTLRILVRGPDSWDERQLCPIYHPFRVPIATYNERTWRRWIFECCRGVENHELGEWFRVGEERPFLPLHGPGEDPYTVHEFRPEIDARTTQDGSVREGGPRPIVEAG